MCLIRDVPTFQTHKVYIQNISSVLDDPVLERLLTVYFQDFGEVVDVKILRNCGLTSSAQTLRLRFFPRGGVRAPGADAAVRPRQQEGGLTSS